MPRRIATLRFLAAAAAVSLGAFVAAGRLNHSMNGDERTMVKLAGGLLLLGLVSFGALLGPLLVIDAVREARVRQRADLVAKRAEAERLRPEV